MEEQVNQKWDSNHFKNEHQDRVLNLTDEKTRKDRKSHEKDLVKWERTWYRYIYKYWYDNDLVTRGAGHRYDNAAGRRVTIKL